MRRAIVPLIGTVLVVLLLVGPGRQYLPAGLRLQLGEASPGGDPVMVMDEGKPTGVGLAPAAVLNPPATAGRLDVKAAPLEHAERGYALSTRLVAPDGKPIEGATVRFYEVVELFGKREMFIEDAVTDGRGDAAIAYLPARTGSHAIVVRFPGANKVTAGEARMTLEASVAAPVRTIERRALASFSDRIPYAAGLVLLAVWALIAFVLFATARGVVVGAHGKRGKEESA